MATATSPVGIQSVGIETNRSVVNLTAPPLNGVAAGDTIRLTAKKTGAYIAPATVLRVISPTVIHVTGLEAIDQLTDPFGPNGEITRTFDAFVADEDEDVEE